ncbi:hypothetical protein RJT34_15783 [Clitoria ternatea]|uniref:Uncharacterized protein n=1 Tax=Clitoria ternatea TaxID=43366 RepID=A0AAN9PBR4_CLITE
MSSSAEQTRQHQHPHPHPFRPWKLLFFIIAALTTLVFSPISLSLSSNFHPKTFKHIFQRNTLNTPDSTTNISHIVFGIAGSAKTWPKRRPFVELWWQPNVTRGFLWLDQAPPENQTWPATSPPFRVSGNTSSFKYTCWYGNRSAIRIARIVKESFELGLGNVRWFVMGDDDTEFFIDNLVTVLSKYDHNQMYYIGGNSESVEQDVIHSYKVAYGGGGFAISHPLAVELSRILDGCIDRYAQLYGGDQKVQACISEIGVQITKEVGFHQVDVRGNPFGLLAAHPVAPLVSLHHLDTVDQLFPTLTKFESIRKLIGSYNMDPGRVLEHTFCYDLMRNWTFSVSWGYSVQLYSSLVTAKELETAFGTFDTWRSSSDGPFVFNTRSVSNDPCQRPLLYFLDRVDTAGLGQTRSSYMKHVDALGKDCGRVDLVGVMEVQLVNVSAPYFTPDLWKKAPRRQCCEIINGTEGVDNVVQIIIRGCHRFESVTPP